MTVCMSLLHVHPAPLVYRSRVGGQKGWEGEMNEVEWGKRKAKTSTVLSGL